MTEIVVFSVLALLLFNSIFELFFSLAVCLLLISLLLSMAIHLKPPMQTPVTIRLSNTVASGMVTHTCPSSTRHIIAENQEFKVSLGNIAS